MAKGLFSILRPSPKSILPCILPKISAGSIFSHSRPAMISHISLTLAGSLHHCCASRTAMVKAFAALGFLSTQSARKAKAFSGWSFQNSPVIKAVYPRLLETIWAFHGSPTQNASMVPTFILATICGGGTTMREMSLLGSMPPADSQ